ncbi:hypothetical protein AJ79_06389 [Helicocarpus griseus UAMH5409]|uniref:Annexin n=1 Tax=Helicocarpus griseus UAMH5409 TaxID=1447875 RepID=A0A2B7XCQ3_9EURO|nr:hypothetical protein AJ79_06389 [Helicocarpus griseus UAMH5409]
MDPSQQQQPPPAGTIPQQPQPGYGYPPYSQPPPGGAPGQYPPAPQGQYPPQGYYPPYGYYPPPGQYPPAPGQAAPGQQPPPQQPVAGQPQQPYGTAIPPQPYGQYPPAPAGYPGYPPPMPGQGGYGGAIPAAAAGPSPGYDPSHIATGDMSDDARTIKKAFGSFNTDESKLIKVLTKPSAPQMAQLRQTYRHDIGKNLEEVIQDKVKRDFGEALLTLVRGPLQNDVTYLFENLTTDATISPPSTMALLDDVLLRRSNADITAIKRAFRDRYNADIEPRLTRCPHVTGMHRTLYKTALKAERMEENMLLDNALVAADAAKFEKAPKNIDPNTAAETELVELLAQRSDAHLRAVAAAFQQMPGSGGMSLEKKVKAIWARSDRKGLKASALYIVRGAVDAAGSEARLLYKCMKGMGTRDSLLIARVVRVHFGAKGGAGLNTNMGMGVPAVRPGWEEVKKAYRSKYDKGLVEVVEKETSGDYEKALVALIEQ